MWIVTFTTHFTFDLMHFLLVIPENRIPWRPLKAWLLRYLKNEDSCQPPIVHVISCCLWPSDAGWAVRLWYISLLWFPHSQTPSLCESQQSSTVCGRTCPCVPSCVCVRFAEVSFEVLHCWHWKWRITALPCVVWRHTLLLWLCSFNLLFFKANSHWTWQMPTNGNRHFVGFLTFYTILILHYTILFFGIRNIQYMSAKSNCISVAIFWPYFPNVINILAMLVLWLQIRTGKFPLLLVKQLFCHVLS